MLSRLLKGSVIYAATDVLRKLAPFFLLPLYVSNLSIGDFGRQEYVTILATLSSYLVGWGSAQGLLRLYVSEQHRSVHASLSIVTALFLLIISVLAVLSFFIPLGNWLGLESTNILFFVSSMGGFTLSIILGLRYCEQRSGCLTSRW